MPLLIDIRESIDFSSMIMKQNAFNSLNNAMYHNDYRWILQKLEILTMGIYIFFYQGKGAVLNSYCQSFFANILPL